MVTVKSYTGNGSHAFRCFKLSSMLAGGLCYYVLLACHGIDFFKLIMLPVSRCT